MGKRTEWNRISRNLIAQISEEMGLDRCEVCGGTFGMAPAHRFSRQHYQSAEELAAFDQWLALCQPCHMRMDDRSKTTEDEKEQLFKRLRDDVL